MGSIRLPDAAVTKRKCYGVGPRVPAKTVPDHDYHPPTLSVILITDIQEDLFKEAGEVVVEVKGKRITRLNRTFHDSMAQVSGELIALAGSHGYLEIAVLDGSAAQLLGVGEGGRVTVSLARCL